MFGRREFLMSGVGVTAALGVPEVMARNADATGFKSTGQPWPLRNSEAFEYHSRAVGDKMAIGVWSPPKMLPAMAPLGDNPPLDVVYVLDGSFALNAAAYALLLRWQVARYDVALAFVLLAVAILSFLANRHWAFARAS